ncbi:MAG: SEC-C domain-containing protein [Saccharospirillum sp.]|uniref:YecA family protein n=1 Tax=Saccharospirillum sp. TaxID=2033801 RepID=UPI0034A05719
MREVIKVTDVGRNEPCPCGSGNKFKRCCMGKQENTNRGTGPAEVMDALGNALEKQEFNSLEEAQSFVAQLTQQQNQRSIDDFQGLSPEQIHWMLNQPFDSPSLVRFPEVLDTQPTAPILQLFNLLTETIGEQGLKPTAKGNLPRNFCREAALTYWGEQEYQRRTRFSGINREDDFYDLHITRIVAELAGLIRKYKGKFILSRECRQLLAKGGLAAVYPRLFRAHVEEFNWAYRSGIDELRFIQHAWPFTLYMLRRHGDTWHPAEFYEGAFLKAFPSIMDEFPPNPVVSPERSVRLTYTIQALHDFAGFLGLATVEPTSDDIFNREYRVRALPLLEKAVQFQV